MKMRIKSIRRVQVDPTPVYDVLNVPVNHNFLVKTEESSIVSHNCAFLDEMNYYEKGGRAANSLALMDTPIMQVYQAIKRRIESRYMVMGSIPGKLFLVSSKSTEDAPLEQYSRSQINNPRALIVDEPLWVINWNEERYSGKFFNLLVGNAYVDTRILPANEDIRELELMGNKVIQVPVEYRDAFETGPNQALKDIAGIALVSGSRFLDGQKYLDVIRKDPPNAFNHDIVVSGVNTPDRLEQYMDLSVLKLYEGKPMWIHIDASKSNDKTGIAGVVRDDGYVEIDRVLSDGIDKETIRDYKFTVALVTSIQAPVGDQIPYRKIFNLILYLRSVGMNIQKVTMDTYQSVMLLQEFETNGIKSGELSVDRTPKPYSYMRISINEGRITFPENELLKKEFTELVEDAKTGRIDHPISGSKDASDSVTGATYEAWLDISDGKSMRTSNVAEAMASLYDDLSDVEPVGSPVRPRSRDLFSEIDSLLYDDDDYY